jgi:hypothetical protein
MLLYKHLKQNLALFQVILNLLMQHKSLESEQIHSLAQTKR